MVDPPYRSQRQRPDWRSVVVARLSSARYPLAASGIIAIIYVLSTGRFVLGAFLYALVIAAAALGPRASQAQRYRARMDALRARTRGRRPGTGAIINALPDPVLVVRRDLTIERANTAARDAFGDVRGLTLPLRFRSPTLRALVEGVAARREPDRLAEPEPFGTNGLYAVRAAPAARSSDDGRTSEPHVVLTFIERTRAQRDARSRSDFVANASHELRTPLTSLIGFIETLRGPARDDAAARERFLGIMDEQARRMSRLVDDLLALSRAERASTRRPRSPVDLASVAERSVAAARPAFEAAGLSLELEIEQGDHVVTGDEDGLMQVVGNLIENALRYGAAGERVEVSVRANANANASEVVVRDWGVGIDPVDLPRLTERFYRADAERSRSTGGTGLGLAIVKHVLARHGSRLRVESQSGEGATFAFSLAHTDRKDTSEQRDRVS